MSEYTLTTADQDRAKQISLVTPLTFSSIIALLAKWGPVIFDFLEDLKKLFPTSPPLPFESKPVRATHSATMREEVATLLKTVENETSCAIAVEKVVDGFTNLMRATAEKEGGAEKFVELANEFDGCKTKLSAACVKDAPKEVPKEIGLKELHKKEELHSTHHKKEDVHPTSHPKKDDEDCLPPLYPKKTTEYQVPEHKHDVKNPPKPKH